MIEKILQKIKEDEEIKKILTDDELNKLEIIFQTSMSELNKKSSIIETLNGENK